MAAIAMRSSPIIPFRKDHQESPPPSPLSPLPSSSSFPSPIPALPSLHSLLLAALPFFLPPPLHTHTQSGVNRPPPALSEQMGEAEDGGLVSLAPHTFHSLPQSAQPLFLFSLILHLFRLKSTAHNFPSSGFCLPVNKDGFASSLVNFGFAPPPIFTESQRCGQKTQYVP